MKNTPFFFSDLLVFLNGVLVGKPEGKRPFGRLKCRWNNIKMCLKDTVKEDMDWINLVQDREWWHALVNMVLKFQLP